MYHYTVPAAKHLRVIIDTDCKNEADDQFALTHHLMTPRFDIMAINAVHFEVRHHDGTSLEKSYQEIMKILRLTGNEGKYRVLRGSQYPLRYDSAERADDKYLVSGVRPFLPKVTYEENEASRFLIEEALRPPSFICSMPRGPDQCGNGAFDESGNCRALYLCLDRRRHAACWRMGV